MLAEIDFSKIPNIKNMPDRFREAYPWGIPTDYGKIGYAYRKDLVSERPTTWADFFELAPKYSGKVILLDVLEDTIGNTLISLGHDGNTSDEGRDRGSEEQADRNQAARPGDHRNGCCEAAHQRRRGARDGLGLRHRARAAESSPTSSGLLPMRA